MIYVRVELWPRGDRKNAQLLGEATIVNDGTGSKSLGNYDAAFSRRGGFGKRSKPERGELTSVHRRSKVVRFMRTKFDAWFLLYMAMLGGNWTGKP